MIIFDTGPLVAAAIKADQWHARSVRLLHDCHDRGEEIGIPSTVVAEVGYMIGRVDHETEAEFLLSLSTDAFRVLDLTPTDFRRCSELVLRYSDLPLGTTDASVVALAERHEVTKVATIDRRHFRVVRPEHLNYFELLP